MEHNQLLEYQRKIHLRSNSLRSTERKLFYPSIPVNDQTNKEYGRIRKQIRIMRNHKVKRGHRRSYREKADYQRPH